MSDMSNGQLMGLNDEDFLTAVSKERAAAFLATLGGWHQCDCDVCERLRALVLTLGDKPIEVIVTPPAEPSPLSMKMVDRLFSRVFIDEAIEADTVKFYGQDGKLVRQVINIGELEEPPNSVTGGQGFADGGHEARRQRAMGDELTPEKVFAAEEAIERNGAEAWPDPPPYGRSPAMDALDDIRAAQEQHRRDWAILRLPSDSAARKRIPLGTGLIDYFPDALAEVAKVSAYGNEKHNPGEPLHHARGKSMDHEDCIARHYVDRYGVDAASGLDEAAFMCWRALAFYQELLERRYKLPLPRGARPA